MDRAASVGSNGYRAASMRAAAARQAQAEAKRRRKGVPLLVGNIGPATFGRDDNALLLLDAQGCKALPAGPKLHLARALVADIARRLGPAV